MIKFFKDVKKYMPYAIYSAKSELKTEVANSYLNWLWWILDPLSFMIIYTFIAKIVFQARGEKFPVFVLIGIITWGFFNRMVLGSIKIIKNNRNTVSKVYIPKYILLLKQSFVYLFKTMISYSLLILLIGLFKVKITFYMLWVIPLFIVFYVITFGFSLYLMHWGVYIDDLFNLTTIILKLMFYLSGIFYNLRIIEINWLFKMILINANPAAFMIDQFRNVLLRGENPNIIMLIIWFLIGIKYCILGIGLIQEHENTYAKVI